MAPTGLPLSEPSLWGWPLRSALRMSCCQPPWRAAHIAGHAPQSLRHTKRLVLATRAAQLDDARAREDEALQVRVGSPENIEAVTAFFDRRKTDFG